MPDHRVKRITFNADADLLEQAKKALGTTSATDAINRSLAEVVRRDSGVRLVERGFSGLTPEMVKELRRPRTF
jgi:Arc/MetJ family transcription regulator